MSFNESFRLRYYIDERETLELIGKPRRYREIVKSNFDGPVAEWADYRTAVFNDRIANVMTFPEGIGDDVHRVSWVWHAGHNPVTGTDFSSYHIACDCSLMAELSGESDSILECETLQKTLNRRAAYWRSELKLDKIARACTDSEDGRNQVTLDRTFFDSETIVWLLEQDHEHPEAWFGNIVSGEHSISLLALVLQEPPEKVQVLVEDLAEGGRLEFDGGQTVRLAA